MKRTVSLCVVLLFSVLAYAQTEAWTTYLNNGQILIEQQLVEDNRPHDGIYNKVVQLRYTNLTNTPLSVKFNRALWYGGNCFGCNGSADELVQQIELGPQEVKTALPQQKDKRFIIFHSRQSGGNALTKFELQNLEVDAL